MDFGFILAANNFKDYFDKNFFHNYTNLCHEEKIDKYTGIYCQKEVVKLAQRVKQRKIILTVTPKCIDHLTEQGYSKEFGARYMARVIEEQIANPLVDEVLFGKLSKGGNVTADYKGTKSGITFTYEKENN